MLSGEAGAPSLSPSLSPLLSTPLPPGGAGGGGDGAPPSSFRVGQPHTEETRRKISEANKGKTPWNKGLKHSLETRRKIAEATRRAMASPTTRARLSTMATGRKHSRETRAKIANACFRTRAARLEAVSAESSTSGGARRLIFGNRAARNARRRPAPFLWSQETTEALNEKVHVLATHTVFKHLSHTDRSDTDGRGRRPMSAETRAKLSARIKELWTDPAYRERVSAGVKNAVKRDGSQRGPLTETHRERIRQSLLRRNAEQREKGDPTPTRHASRRPSRRPSSDRLATPGRGADPMAGTKHSDALLTPLEREARVAERATVARQVKKEEDAKRRQALRKAQRVRRQEREAERVAAKQRAQDGLLLELLASAGQLPSLTDDGDGVFVSGRLSSSPIVFDDDGLRTAGEGGLFESSSRLSTSADPTGGTGVPQPLYSSGGNAAVNLGAAGRGGRDSLASDVHIPLDFDIYAPLAAAARVPGDEDDDGGNDDDGGIDGDKGEGADDDGVDVGDMDDIDAVLAEVARAQAPVDDSCYSPLASDVVGVADVAPWSGEAVGERGDAGGSSAACDVDPLSVVAGNDSFADQGVSSARPAAAKGKSAEERKRVVTYVNGKAAHVDL